MQMSLTIVVLFEAEVLRRSIDFAENFDPMRCKTKAFGVDSHKKL